MFTPTIIPLPRSADEKIPSYKLYYFDARGLAETTRQLFALAGQPFEDVRYSTQIWPEHKEEMPFGQVPVLEVDGVKIPQSFAIARYVAKQFGFAGKTDFESAWVDAFGDQFKDYFNELHPLHEALAGTSPEDMEKLRKEILEPARDKFFTFVERQLKARACPFLANKSGFLVGDDVTWVDLAVAEHSDVLLQYRPDFLDVYPAVLAHHEKVRQLPKIKEWLSVRPEATLCAHPHAMPDQHHPLIDKYMEAKANEEQMIGRDRPGRCHEPTRHFAAANEHEA